MWSLEEENKERERNHHVSELTKNKIPHLRLDSK